MLQITKISFPGLGIGEFKVNSEAFRIGNFSIAWYAIFICLGMIAAVAYVIFRSKRIGIDSEDVLDIALFTIPIGVIGARLYYVLMEIDNFNSLGEVLNIRNGGLAIYGGIIAGSITVFCVTRFKKINFLAFADCVVPALILAQAIGRWGNFMNAEAFGYETEIFCRMGLDFGRGFSYYHPTFLYESLWNIIGFIGINIFYKYKKYDGQIFYMIFGWYGLGRAWIEGLRTDSLYIWNTNLRVSQVLAIVLFVACTALQIYFAIKRPDKPLYYCENKKKKAVAEGEPEVVEALETEKSDLESTEVEDVDSNDEQ